MLSANDTCSWIHAHGSVQWFINVLLMLKCFIREVYINTKYTKHLQLSMTLTNLGILKIQKLDNGKK